MNYQVLIESYASGETISKDELSLLELELASSPTTIFYKFNVFL